MRYLPRVAETTLKRYLSVFSVVGITGPRQSGKSTLLQHCLKDYRYVTFDDLNAVNYFTTDPNGFMKEYDNRVIFDEVQQVPEIFHYVKMAVDNDRQNYGKFILTGSSQFGFMKHVSESLAGRIGLMSLLPFQYQEMPKRLTKESIFKGGYPELVDRNYEESELWFSSYFDTYLNKDVRAIANIGDLRDFSRFIRLLAANASEELNMASYAKELGVSMPTIKRWVSVLEASYIIFLLPPFYNNYGKRIIKRPKIYFYDTGLVSFLTGIKTFEQYDQGPMAGSLFENYIVTEIKKRELHTQSHAELFYLRMSGGQEVDLIIDRKTEKEFIEIKKTSTPRLKMVEHIETFMEPGDKGLLIYNGDAFSYGENLQAMNYKDYL